MKKNSYSYVVIRDYIMYNLVKDPLLEITEERILKEVKRIKEVHPNLWDEESEQMPLKNQRGKVKNIPDALLDEIGEELIETLVGNKELFGVAKLENSITEFFKEVRIVDTKEDVV
ncbi:MAG: hypothetical protein ACRCZ9_02445 [Fusobacteriaceae bacterium]